MSRRVLGAALLAVAMAWLAGCEGAWNAANTKALVSDMSDLLMIAGATNLRMMDCSMLGTTRTGYCTVPIEPLVLKLFVKGLKLRESPAAPEEWQVEGGCASQEIEAAEGTRIYVSKRRPPELRLRGGASFEYLLLYTAPDGRSCVQVSYAYS